MNLKQKVKLYVIRKLIDFLLFKENIYIKKSFSEKELNEVREFVFNVYAIEKKYIEPKFFPKKIFEDEFDKYSIYFAAYHKKLKYTKERIQGAIRMVLNSELGFPIEKLFNLSPVDIDKNQIAEISRLIVINVGKDKDKIALALCTRCFEESLSRGIKYWYAFLSQRLKEYFEKKYRVQFIELKCLPPTLEHQQQRIPYRFYFDKFKPLPYLIELEKVLKHFKI